MYIPITDHTRQLHETLVNMTDDDTFVVHYRCPFCSDEQVTYGLTKEEFYNAFIYNDDCLRSRLECTNCGKDTLYIYADDIFGIELLDKE